MLRSKFSVAAKGVGERIAITLSKKSVVRFLRSGNLLACNSRMLIDPNWRTPRMAPTRKCASSTSRNLGTYWTLKTAKRRSCGCGSCKMAGIKCVLF